MWVRICLSIIAFVIRWDFLDSNELLDLCAASGLKKLEEYFQGKYDEVEEIESKVQGINDFG